MQSFWEDDPLYTSISIQVLQESFAVFMNKKMPFEHAQNIIELYSKWNLIPNDKPLLTESIRIKQKHQLSIWDALIIAAAKAAGSKYLLTEDLSHNHVYDGIKVINPFLKD